MNKLKIANYTKSRTITLIKLKNTRITLTQYYRSIRKTLGAKFHMLIYISVKFHDSRSNTFWVTCDTSCFTMSRTISLKILNIFTRKYPGAQLHMLINIPVKFHDYCKYFLSYMSHNLKIAYFYKVKGNNFNNTKYIHTKIPMGTNTYADQHFCNVSWL
jgi:hypothetical protein